ncbi:MAG TPA: hypothetical protein VF570_01265 [Pyrinomonadaceae bacterium]|jgi:hypothetical protein
MPDPVRTDEKKCAHQTCTCMVEGARRFCSDYCEDANDSDPTSVCTCDHPGCKSNR